MNSNYKTQAQYDRYTIGVCNDGKVEVLVNDKLYEGSINSLLKNEIAAKLGFESDPKWNPRTLGRKLIDYINAMPKKTTGATIKPNKPAKEAQITKKNNTKKETEVRKESKETKKIREWCESVGLKKYEILPNNEIDAWGFVDLEGKVSDSLPDYIQFNHIHQSLPFFHADFNIANCNLKTLRGCPRYVEGNLYIQNNKLSNLSYLSSYVGRSIVCYGNAVNFSIADIRTACDATWIMTTKTSFLDEPKKSKKQKTEE